ncbi:hypothetical protein LTR62_001971 [Meristemomyces frigidus]|uniref:OTU domain-containing protein n=1 Tax=Meristemomyces frigidus TaxID=1508187 RepID=A0AAN7T7R3_9PEZI|nr:hypothetical protein LTR62_001971 [Meristemomyces frigidus]
MEELQARHRKEARDLQSRITQKKKQASKKTRRVVNDECEGLEKELKERQATEVAGLKVQLSGEEDEEGVGERVEGLCLGDGDGEVGRSTTVDEHDHDHDNSARNPGLPPTIQNTEPSTTKKPNRAKARLARRAADLDQQALTAAAEAQKLPDLKTQERERMLAAMKERGLREKEIRADGHCLYSAVADQLGQLGVALSVGAADGEEGEAEGGEGKGEGYRLVRATAADFISVHSEDFLPFLEEPLDEYVHKIRETGEWGGQLELLALAKSYGVDINVLRDFGRVERIEAGGVAGKVGGVDATEVREMWLGYYRHGFGLGEHYNSLRRVGG